MRTILFLLCLTLSASVHAQWSSVNTYQYNVLGYPTLISNAAGNTERFAWDAFGRLQTYTDPLQQNVTYTYGAGAHPIKVQMPNRAVTTYQTYGLKKLHQETSPDRGVTDYNYDAAGNLTSYINRRGALVRIAYDALNRPMEKRLSRPDNIVDAIYGYQWDVGTYGIGRLGAVQVSRNDSLQSSSFVHDHAGRIAERTQSRNGAELHTSYSYTANGRTDTFTYPSGGQLSYEYDDIGNVISLSWDGVPLIASIEYDPFGPPTELVFGNGIVHRRLYNAAGRPDAFTLAGETYALGYDAAGRVNRIASVSTQFSQSFEYDAAGRLTRYDDGNAEEIYAYDANGNRISLVRDNQNLAYSYQSLSNLLIGISGRGLVYDAAGNLIQDQRQFSYDAESRLIEVQQGSRRAIYEYNAFGERTYKHDSTQGRQFFYDDAGRLMGEYNEAGQPVMEYVWLGNLPLAVRRYTSGLGQTYYIETDHLGTPRVITDDSRRVRWYWLSTPFGETPPNENPSGAGILTFNLRFPGQYYDAESGMHYNYFRDYDPAIGRYIQSDPIGLMGGANTFSYAMNNPAGLTDPLGLFAVIEGGFGEEEEILRKYGNFLKDAIDKMCPGAEKDKAIELFARWRVQVDPKLKNLSRNKSDFAITKHKERSTVFYSPFFDFLFPIKEDINGNIKPIRGNSKLHTFFHEFRHLYEENQSLKDSSHIKKSLFGTDYDKQPIEIDADDFAKKMIGRKVEKCECVNGEK